LALIHIIGHACLRTLQLLRAPTLLMDYQNLRNAMGTHLPQEKGGWLRWIPPSWQTSLYRFALERGSLDALLNRFVVLPFLKLFHWCDNMERRWTDFLSGTTSREFDQVSETAQPAEEFS
ncbi:MAG: oxidoreductase, partial [Planctomycetaceae bacterium]|nr:oxidoreductase [Planctomycetaceae bacterium]